MRAHNAVCARSISTANLLVDGSNILFELILDYKVHGIKESEWTTSSDIISISRQEHWEIKALRVDCTLILMIWHWFNYQL